MITSKNENSLDKADTVYMIVYHRWVPASNLLSASDRKLQFLIRHLCASMLVFLLYLSASPQAYFRLRNKLLKLMEFSELIGFGSIFMAVFIYKLFLNQFFGFAKRFVILQGNIFGKPLILTILICSIKLTNIVI